MKPLFQNHKNTYEALCRQYGNVAYYAAYTVLHDTARAEAAVLEAFRRLLPFLSRLEPVDRAQVKYLVVLVAWRVAWRLGGFPINDQRPAGELALRSNDGSLGDIAALMWELPELQQEIMLLKYDMGFRAAEIELLLDIPRDKVKERLRLAQESLALRVIQEGEQDE